MLSVHDLDSWEADERDALAAALLAHPCDCPCGRMPRLRRQHPRLAVEYDRLCRGGRPRFDDLVSLRLHLLVPACLSSLA
jgi:hypothetical protein